MAFDLGAGLGGEPGGQLAVDGVQEDAHLLGEGHVALVDADLVADRVGGAGGLAEVFDGEIEALAGQGGGDAVETGLHARRAQLSRIDDERLPEVEGHCVEGAHVVSRGGGQAG